MSTLWRKFPDEAITGKHFSGDAKRKLEDVLANHPTSPWVKALTLLGMRPQTAPMLRWHQDIPYLNWSVFIDLISGSTMSAERSNGSYTIVTHTGLKNIWRLIKAQWGVSRYMNRALPENLGIAESLALGLVLQSLLIRLGAQADNLPALLAAPDQAPQSLQKILKDIQAVQMRRTQLSSIWMDVLPDDGSTAVQAPEFFWDDMEEVQDAPPSKGQSVCAGMVTGIALAVDSKTYPTTIHALKSKYNAPIILVFRYAKPDTTLLFPYAQGLVFCEGGVLSHACTVARESNIPSITNMGAAFFETVQAGNIWLALDGAAGTATPL